MPLFRKQRTAKHGLRVLAASSLRLNLEDKTEAKRLRALRQGWQCADAETEILTTRGWLGYGELAVGDMALTLNHETGESEWQPVEAVNTYEVEDAEMISMEGRLHSSLTTTGHKWPVLDRQSEWTSADTARRRERRHGLEPQTVLADRAPATMARRMVCSDALTSRQSLVTAAPCVDLPQGEVHDDAFVELVAWFWTEGYQRPTGYTAITQSERVNPECVKRIRAALTETFGPAHGTTRGLTRPAWRESRDGDCVVFALNRFAGRRLMAVAPCKIVDSGFIRSLTLAQLELFVQTSIDADGHRDDGTNVVLTQAKRERIEPLILAAILTGRTPHLYPRRNGQWTVHLRDKATVSPVGASKTEWTNRAKVVRKRYTGTVWCPTLPNHTWLARRNGTVYYTGNSDAWNYRDSIGELRYAINFLANSAARMRLFVGVEPMPGEEEKKPLQLSESSGIPAEVATEASLALADLAANEGTRRTIMKMLSTNVSTAGECFVLGRVDPETSEETWTIRSLDELAFQNDEYELREIPDGPQGIIPWVKLDPKLTTASRVWLPHPRFSLLADSSMRAMLADNESLLIMRRMIRSDSRSRLGRGLLLIPDELSIKVPEDDNEDPEADPFMGALTQAMMEPISDEGVASAVVPIVIRGPAEAMKELRKIDLHQPYEKEAAETREELIGIIATSFDLPKEVIMGTTDLNHWSAWNVDDNTFRHHIEPHVIDLCDALTGGYFHPRLLANGVPPEYVNRLVIWYDPTELVTHPDQTSDALKLHENLVLSDAALLRIAGFSEEDAPTKQEIQVRLLEKMRQWPPNLVMAFLHAWDPTLTAPAMAGPPAIPGISPKGVETAQEPEAILPGRPGAPQIPAETNGTAPVSEAEQPQIGPPAEPITAAGNPETDRLSRKLAQIDRDLRTRLQTAANAAMRRQLERVGANLRTKVAKDETMRTKIAHRPNERVSAILGKQALTAAHISPEDLMGNDWSALRAQFYDWTEAAQKQAVATAVRIGALTAESDAVRVAEAAMIQGRDKAWAWLSEALTHLGDHLLYNPDANVGPAEWGDLNPDALVPTGTIRAALGIAGGGDVALDPGGVTTMAAGEVVGQIGTGATITELLGEGGTEVAAYVWEHGSMTIHPFEPHLALDGVQFVNFDDPVLANPDDWPDNQFLTPGDHSGCGCDAVPIYVTAEQATELETA